MFKAGELCEFVPYHSGGGFMYELSVIEIRDGKVCQPNFDDSTIAQCALPSNGPYIVLLVMRSAPDDHLNYRWAALYQETLVEIYESDLVRIGPGYSSRGGNQ